MSRILKAITDSSVSEIEAGGFLVRVRRVRSSDLAEVGVAALAMVGAAPKEGDKQPDISKNISPDQAKKLAGYQEAVCCAALLALGDPSNGEWDTVKVVMDAKKENPGKGVLWVGSLPGPIVSAVFAEAMRLSTGGEEAAERLARFRRPA
jgi:hypothetical protein